MVSFLPFLPPGFLLGSRETLLETKDGGRTWSPRSVAAAQDEGARTLPNRIECNAARGDGGSPVQLERLVCGLTLPGMAAAALVCGRPSKNCTTRSCVYMLCITVRSLFHSTHAPHR